MNDTRFDIEWVLLSYYIRYDILDQLIQPIANSPYKESNIIDVYVDLYDYTLPLYNTNVFSKNRFTIVSSIMNLAAHIRRFFYTRYRIRTNIFLVYGSDTAQNHKQFQSNFGSFDKLVETANYYRVNDLIQSQLELVKILCGYIDGVYFIKRSTDFCMFTYDRILKTTTPAIVWTKDRYAYMITSMIDRAFLFRPKKYGGDDTSFCVNHAGTLMSYYNRSTSNETVMNKLMALNPNILSLMVSLTGIIDKGMKSLINMTTVTNKVYDAIINKQALLNDRPSDIRYAYNQLDISKVSEDEFENRFRAVDITYQNILYNNSVEVNDNSWFINLIDKSTLYQINNEYFVNNPIDLMALSMN